MGVYMMEITGGIIQRMHVETVQFSRDCTLPAHGFNVDNVNLRGYKWNETVSNRICNISNEMC
jgi:hypothetical protein